MKLPASHGRVLVVDDSAVNRRLTADVLTERGFDVVVAESGPAALTLIHSARPDMVLMDVQMPGMSGLDAIGLVRAENDLAIARTVIIAMTALAMPGDRERCLAAGADDYISRPVSIGTLVSRVGEAVRFSRSR